MLNLLQMNTVFKKIESGMESVSRNAVFYSSKWNSLVDKTRAANIKFKVDLSDFEKEHNKRDDKCLQLNADLKDILTLAEEILKDKEVPDLKSALKLYTEQLEIALKDLHRDMAELKRNRRPLEKRIEDNEAAIQESQIIKARCQILTEKNEELDFCKSSTLKAMGQICGWADYALKRPDAQKTLLLDIKDLSGKSHILLSQKPKKFFPAAIMQDEKQQNVDDIKIERNAIQLN